MLRHWVLALVSSIGMAGAVHAQDLTPKQRDATIDFVLNNTHHVMLHEIGHMLVDQLDLPVLGKEEDAVDMFATLTIIEEGNDHGFITLADTVDGWLFSEGTRPSRGYVNSDFYGAHSLDIQRSFTIACLMVGSDYDSHTRYATRVSLPIDRQKSCAEDYRVASKGWAAVLAPHERVGTFGAPVTVRYQSAGEYREIAAILRQAKILENAGDWLTKNYFLPNPVSITAEVCGEVNAFYVPGDRQVILCYEWADYFYDLFAEEILPIREHFALMRELKSAKMAEMG